MKSRILNMRNSLALVMLVCLKLGVVSVVVSMVSPLVLSFRFPVKFFFSVVAGAVRAEIWDYLWKGWPVLMFAKMKGLKSPFNEDGGKQRLVGYSDGRGLVKLTKH